MATRWNMDGIHASLHCRRVKLETTQSKKSTHKWAKNAKKIQISPTYSCIFASIFRDPAPYLDIIRILATRKQGITRDEICEVLGKHNNGHIKDYLTNLQKCDFIRYYFRRTRKVINVSSI